MKFLKCLLLGFLAGMCISFGGLVSLTCTANNLKILGNILFSLGLLAICIFGFNLYTGKIGYLFESKSKKSFVLDLLTMYLGNIIGTVGVGYLLRLTGLCNNETFMEVCNKVGQAKLLNMGGGFGQTWYGALILAFFCGVLVFLSVHLFNKTNFHPIVKVVGLILFIGAFVIIGFEHCIADMFYLAISNVWGTNFGEAILFILIVTVGNSLGSLSIWGIFKLCFQNKEN